uniref:Uncharacterized protein n=3 Tax=Lutzomyia longipalpis TaxID=7200 RepID=A0A1B0CT02_LUTLO
MFVAGFAPEAIEMHTMPHDHLPNHRASFHGRATSELNGSATAERLVHSTPGSPQERRMGSTEVIGSAESLVGRVLVEQGLGKYCDADFVRYTSREMQEALEMTKEEMDYAAHELLQRNPKRPDAPL